MSEYTNEHAESGIEAELPQMEYWPNQFSGYAVTVSIPEFTSICPKTGLPDFGLITIEYEPDARCIELKSLKNYILAYRNLGIFYENAVNRILEDIVNVCSPIRAKVVGKFSARGGMTAIVEAQYNRDGQDKQH